MPGVSRAAEIKVMVVDDHEVVRRGLIGMLEAAREIKIVAQAASASEAIRKAKELKPDVVLLDIRLPGQSGLDACRSLHAQAPDSRVLILTTYDEEEYLFEALKGGAWGYLLKTASYAELVEAITKVAAGKRLISHSMMDKLVTRFAALALENARLEAGFSQDELDILRLLAEGVTNKEIARRLHWSEVSIKRKLQAIFDKLGVQDRTRAVVEAMRQGLI